MSGEKGAVADLSWEFTAGLVRGILIGGGIVQDRSCVGGRRAACWEKAGRGEEEGTKGGTAWVGTVFFLFWVAVWRKTTWARRGQEGPSPQNHPAAASDSRFIYSEQKLSD